jgi:hypothetical protein
VTGLLPAIVPACTNDFKAAVRPRHVHFCNGVMTSIAATDEGGLFGALFVTISQSHFATQLGKVAMCLPVRPSCQILMRQQLFSGARAGVVAVHQDMCFTSDTRKEAA